MGISCSEILLETIEVAIDWFGGIGSRTALSSVILKPADHLSSGLQGSEAFKVLLP
jgi:hypothetical protein